MVNIHLKLLCLTPIIGFINLFNFFCGGESEDQVINGIIQSFSKRMKQKYNVHLVTTGLGMDNSNTGYEYVMTGFNVPYVLSQDEARALILNGLNIFLEEINSSEKMKPLIYKYPFTYKNIGLEFYFRHPDGSKTSDPDIASMYINRGESISYLTNDPNHQYRFKNDIQESYSEALEKWENYKKMLNK